MRNIFFKITNKELETYKLNKLENFQDVNEKEIISGNKCPSFYNKLGDICCPTKIIDNNCVPDKDSNKTKSGGLPICALTYDAASDWMKKNGKIIRLCSEFPPSSKPFKRDNDEPECDKDQKLINNKCLPECPLGFKEEGSLCIPISFDRTKFAGEITCPKDSQIYEGKCLKNCPFGFSEYKNMCLPNELSSF
jgi:hypothetical protein